MLLSEFSGPIRLGAREAKVNISFSYLVAVQIKEETNAAKSPLPAPANEEGSGGQSGAAESSSPASPANEQSVEDLAEWLKEEIVTIDGRKWADWRYVPMLKGKKDYSHNPVYTRFLTTSYKGQLLEVTFTSNLDTNPELKQEIDHIMDSVHLEE